MKDIFYILLFLSLFISEATFGQTNSSSNLLNNKKLLFKKSYRTDNIIGLAYQVSIYKLTSLENVPKRFAGNFVSFQDSGRFTSGYSAWCGNDNFTTVYGQYEFVDNDNIRISVESIRYTGEWKKPTEFRKQNFLTFKVSKTNNGVVYLTKQ